MVRDKGVLPCSTAIKKWVPGADCDSLAAGLAAVVRGFPRDANLLLLPLTKRPQDRLAAESALRSNVVASPRIRLPE